MRFLTGPEIRTEAQRISRRPGKLRAAVAYWGDGAAERTGLSERESVTATFHKISSSLSKCMYPADK